jgi:hypothetical protein
MSRIKCFKCNTIFDGEVYPECPSCLSKFWSHEPDFVKAKHDPYRLPNSLPRFRSVLSCDFVDNLEQFAGSATHMGTWYYSTRHHEYCHVTEFPLHTIPGSAVFKGNPMPTVALNGLLVASPNDKPHAYCVDIQAFHADVAAGYYLRLPPCSEAGCRNLSKPGSDKCLEHNNS